MIIITTFTTTSTIIIIITILLILIGVEYEFRHRSVFCSSCGCYFLLFLFVVHATNSIKYIITFITFKVSCGILFSWSKINCNQ